MEGQVMYVPDCDAQIKPYKGKMFSNLDDATTFYSIYGNEGGFDIRKSSGTKVGNVYTWRTIVCSRQGLKNVTDDDFLSDGNGVVKKRRRNSFRCECPAKIVLKFVGESGYVVNEFIEGHNHMLVEKPDKRFMRINRKLDHVHQMFILDCAKAGIGPTHAHRMMNELLGGQDNVGCTVTDVRNFARDMRAYVEGSDAQMLLNEMAKKRSCVKHSHMSTKLTQMENCKGSFGRDNHGRAVTFAAGLLSKEDKDSFTWLFEKFIESMGKSPKLIITGQDLGMKAAIDDVLGGTRHRWCMWHIMLKLADKVSSELRANEEFKKELNACVWSDLIEPKEFDKRWGDIMLRYGLKGHSCMVYRDVQITKVLGTSLLSGFSAKRAIENNIHIRKDNNAYLNYLDKSVVPVIKTRSAIEKHAAEVYTGKVFKNVQEEIVQSLLNCRMMSMDVGNQTELYSVIDDFNGVCDVLHDSIEDSYTCSCKLFGRMGYLCRHVFYVLKNKGEKRIPERYLIGRWKKFCLLDPVHGVEMDEVPNVLIVDENKRLMNKIMATFFTCMHKIDGDKAKITKFLSIMEDARKTIVGDVKKPTNDDTKNLFEEYYGARPPQKIDVFPPDPVKTKGSGSRKISRKEAAIRKENKALRRCAKCGEKARHDARNCDKVKNKEGT